MRIDSLSIAAPAYNEESHIESLLTNWVHYFREQKFTNGFEIVVCDDGSHDNTAAVIRNLSSEYPEIRLVQNPKNQGAAAALWRAIENTTHEWVLLQDSDGQFPISNFDRLTKALSENPNALALSGMRIRKNDSLFNRGGSWMSGAICNWVHGSAYEDFNCAFKLIRGEVLRNLTLESKGMNYSVELTSKLLEAGIQQVEVEVEVDKRPAPKRTLKSNYKRARDRFLFVSYVALRHSLIKAEVIRQPTVAEHSSKTVRLRSLK